MSTPLIISEPPPLQLFFNNVYLVEKQPVKFIVFDLTPVVLDATWYQLHYRCVFQFCVYFANAC